MASMLRDERVAAMDVLAIQEPWRNPFMATTHHPAKDIFHLCYPEDGLDRPARVCFFINKRLDNTKWQFQSHTRDACSLLLKLDSDGSPGIALSIHNIYNPPRGTDERESALPQLHRLLETGTADEQIVLGDFNLHHSMWGGENVAHPEREAEELIELMENYNMSSTLRTGTVTYEESFARTTIDLCWASIGLLDRLIRCEVDRGLDHDSDHLPIRTMLDLNVTQQQKKPTRNWRKLNDQILRKKIEDTLPPLERPRTRTALDRYIAKIVSVINTAVQQVLPAVNPSPRAREGWDAECSLALAEAKRLKRRHNQEHTDESWEAYREARNKKTKTIRKALKTAHRERVQKAAASPASMWKLVKWARTRESQPPSVTPAIKCPATGTEVTEASAKAALFKDAFFPPSIPAELEDTVEAQHNDRVEFPKITEKEVEDAIKATHAFKAPGPDGIPNKVLQIIAEPVAKHLSNIFNQSLHLGYCPTHFRAATTVVLRKPGKDNYMAPKAYRPIALLNTIGKIMDAVLARRLSYLVETHDVLPHMQMGGRRQRSTEHALHTIVERIYRAWNKGRGQVASLLLLDVSGAFDNVSHERLLHNLRKRRVDEKTVKWVASFLSERRTRIMVDGYESEEYSVQTGIPQGSPLSPLLYIFYNSDLIEDCGSDGTTVTTGYIDDAAILACGDSTEETCEKLRQALERAQIWAARHASKFAPEKFQLTHFTRRRKFDIDMPIDTPGYIIKPTDTCKYLGVTMDTKLRWKAHIDGVTRRVTNTVNALSSLGSSTWGASLADMRKMYRGVAIPQMMYACSIWSNGGTAGRPYTKQALTRLQSLQARAARSICGAFKATSQAALDVETHLLPVEQQIGRHNMDTLGRVLSCNSIPDLIGAKRACGGRQGKGSYSSPLRNIYQNTTEQVTASLQKQEIIPPFVVAPWWIGPRTVIEDEETACATHDRVYANSRRICIYTDGSSIDGHVGAAAVYPAKGQKRSAYMGTDKVSTVYAAELQGLLLAIDIARTETASSTDRQHIAIFTDNQAAIRSLTRPEGRSGAYILKQIAERLRLLQHEGHFITVRWIPSHEGIDGNEAADIAAKEATGWREDDTRGATADPPAELYPLKATLKMWCRKAIDKQWKTSWARATKGRATFRYAPAPSKKILKLHEGLSKSESALLVQLRTEKIGLNDFLFHRNVPGILDPRCPCGYGRQTVRHVLLACRRHKDLRKQHLSRSPGCTDLRAILTKRKLATKAITFMEQTQILGRRGIPGEETTSGIGGRL